MTKKNAPTAHLMKKNAKKLRKKRRRRRLKASVRTTLSLLLAFFVVPIFQDYIYTLDPAQYSIEEIIAQAKGRQLNTSSKELTRIPVFAHRGFVENSIGNSFESIDLALLSGCPQVEIDVRSSSDGILYMSHDDNLSPISASDWNISQHTSAELDGILMKNGEKLHRLSEVFDRYRDQLIYLVELKDDSPDPQPFLDVVASYPKLTQNIQAQSFNQPLLENVHTALPNMFVQSLISDSNKIAQALEASWLDSLAVDQNILSWDLIGTIHETNKEVWVWTIDNLEDVHRYLSWGVDGVITDLDSAVAIYREYTGP